MYFAYAAKKLGDLMDNINVYIYLLLKYGSLFFLIVYSQKNLVGKLGLKRLNDL